MKFPRRKFLHLAAGAVVLSFVSRVAWAQGVVLYEESPTEPQGKRSVGSAIWRTETASRVRGQPPVLAIRADVEIPERNLAMTWLLYATSIPRCRQATLSSSGSRCDPTSHAIIFRTCPACWWRRARWAKARRLQGLPS